MSKEYPAVNQYVHRLNEFSKTIKELSNHFPSDEKTINSMAEEYREMRTKALICDRIFEIVERDQLKDIPKKEFYGEIINVVKEEKMNFYYFESGF